MRKRDEKRVFCLQNRRYILIVHEKLLHAKTLGKIDRYPPTSNWILICFREDGQPLIADMAIHL